MAHGNGNTFFIDQPARDLARDAQNEIRAHVQLWRQDIAARDRRDADFQENIKETLRAIQKAYETGQQSLLAQHALAVSDIRGDLAAHEGADQEKFRDIYAKMWTALGTAFVSVLAAAAALFRMMFHGAG